MDFLQTLLIACIPAAITGFLAFKKFQHDWEKYRMETMAESTAKHLLERDEWTDRRFDTIKKYLGGYQDEELRRVLVRAGAIRTYDENDVEWWTLLERISEKMEKRKK